MRTIKSSFWLVHSWGLVNEKGQQKGLLISIDKQASQKYLEKRSPSVVY